MTDPKINNNWTHERTTLRKFLIAGLPLFVVITALVLSPFKSCNSLGRLGRQDVYNPGQQNKGFVKKSNELMDVLLRDTASTGKPVTDLASLNRKYRALDFDLPYASDSVACIEGSDLRLVAIHSDRIPEEWRSFYFNSRLPQLLEQQKQNLAESYFRINVSTTTVRGVKSMKVNNIRLVPSMFKVALRKDPWNGTIYAPENSLFKKGHYIFLTYGNTVLPIRIGKDKRKTFNRSSFVTFKTIDNKLVYNTTGKDIDLYEYYNSTLRNTGKSIAINLEKNNGIYLYCKGSHQLVIKTDFNFNHGKKQLTAGREQTVNYKDGDKLIFYNKANHKLAEFTISEDDPTRTLSCLTHTSLGTSRYIIPRQQTDLFTQQVIRSLARNLSNKDSVNDVKISIDPLLSREFEKELHTYLDSLAVKVTPQCQTGNEYDMSLTVMDMSTGNIVASPFYMTRFSKSEKSNTNMQMTTRNVALSRRYLGSTFKPLLALAAVMSNPKLLELETQGKYSILDTENNEALFYGHKVTLWAKDTNHWGGTDFTTFLSRSDDVYPVALATIALAQMDAAADTLPAGKVGGEEAFCLLDRTHRLALNGTSTMINDSQPFFYWLSYLYNLNTRSDETNSFSLFDGLYKENKNTEEQYYGLSDIKPDETNLHVDQFQGTPVCDIRGSLVPWVLGQGSNEWSCFKIAEAWSRMLTKHDVYGHFICTDSIPRNIEVDNKYLGPWNTFLGKLEDAQKGNGTLLSMYNAVQTLNRTEGTNLILYSKTGTPNAYMRDELPLLDGSRRYMDVGLYTFALKRDRKSGKGLVCVIRITRTYKSSHPRHSTCKLCEKVNGIQSTDARNFFSSNPKRLKKYYDMTKQYY